MPLGWTHLSCLILVAGLVVTAVAASAEDLQARVELAQSETNFVYTIFNDEPAGSSRHLNRWQLELYTPFQVTGTPPGWNYATDNASYVSWFSTDSDEPYPHDIAPGSSLTGFALTAVVSTSEALSFSAMSWQHGTTNSGPSIIGSVTAPSILSFAAKIVNPSWSPERFEFTVEGVPSLLYDVETSSDLQQWTTVKTGAAPFTFEETPPLTAGLRFFRISCVDTFVGLSEDPAE